MWQQYALSLSTDQGTKNGTIHKRHQHFFFKFLSLPLTLICTFFTLYPSADFKQNVDPYPLKIADVFYGRSLKKGHYLLSISLLESPNLEKTVNNFSISVFLSLSFQAIYKIR